MKAEFRAGGVGYGHFKQRLYDTIRDYFAPMRARREALIADPGRVDDLLREGAARASAIARETMERVRVAVGLR
jgi:tryptophanyl-tRNA synthetase